VLLAGAELQASDFAWRTASPEQEGLSSKKLEALKEALAARRTTGLLVVRHGKIVYEWYAPDAGVGKPHFTASLAKALVGGMSLLVALDDGRIALDDSASKYIPAWRDDAQKSRITIRQLATHSSGIEDAEEDHKPHDQLSGWKGAFWKREPDPFTVAIHQAPVIFPPGSRYAYSNTGMAALAYAVTASLKGAPQTDLRGGTGQAGKPTPRDLRALLRERIMVPLEIPDNEWSIGYGRAYEVDGLKLYANWGGGSYTARAAARVGQLMLHRGEWNHRQLVSREWARKAVSHAGTPIAQRGPEAPNPASGLGWWTNFDGVWTGVPRDAFAGAGAGHQVLLVVPSLGLTVVRNGAALEPSAGSEAFWLPVVRHLFQPVMEAVTSTAPYPPSPVVRGVSFEPEARMVRKALDSDNWPITWADDGHQYAAYGDGWGFEPRTDRKLSLGFARIIGSPDDFQGINVRSPSGERTGDGKNGPKASGLLMVDGVLYMWVRNTGNAQLVWSADHARTWNWGFRFETSFGSPTFLNFAKNYQGARDPYVYVYSQDGPSAYESDDRLLLARVPRDRIRDRGAYEFFVRLDKSGAPVWSRDIQQRGGVFDYPAHCQRSDAVYNPALRRYLLALGYNHRGGWGIFDSPEPWGPWTTVFHTEDWGLGGTHGYRLPSKWISPDGRTMHLVFSGVKLPHITYDAFCVRKFTLDPSEPRP